METVSHFMEHGDFTSVETLHPFSTTHFFLDLKNDGERKA